MNTRHIISINVLKLNPTVNYRSSTVKLEASRIKMKFSILVLIAFAAIMAVASGDTVASEAVNFATALTGITPIGYLLGSVINYVNRDFVSKITPKFVQLDPFNDDLRIGKILNTPENIPEPITMVGALLQLVKTFK